MPNYQSFSVGEKSSNGNTALLFWWKFLFIPIFLLFFKMVTTGLSTGYCFNGPVSKRLQLSQNLFRATIIATLQKIEKKKEKRKHCSKFGKTQNWRLLKTINQIPTEHLDWPVEPKSPITPQYFFYLHHHHALAHFHNSSGLCSYGKHLALLSIGYHSHAHNFFNTDLQMNLHYLRETAILTHSILNSNERPDGEKTKNSNTKKVPDLFQSQNAW